MGLAQYLGITTLQLDTHRNTAVSMITGMQTSRVRGGCGTALQTGRSRVRFPMVSLEFFIDVILPGRFSL